MRASPKSPPTEVEAIASGWFSRRGLSPLSFQRRAWEAYARGASGLIFAPTGCGKTLAAFLGPAGAYLAAPDSGPGLRFSWVTPLRALVTDTVLALREAADDLGTGWRVAKRTSDTGATERDRQRDVLPEVLVTTPESLSLLLSRPSAASQFARLGGVVVDEWHELLSTKRGTQTELALARLRALRPGLQIWGLSATIGNPDEALEALYALQSRWSVIPAADERLVERLDTPEGYHLFLYPFEGRAVHEGLASLFAYRLSQVVPITFSMAVNE